jgi:hypothetical protein
MPWGAAAAAAASLGAAAMDTKSQKDAASAQGDQLEANQAFIKQQAEKSREDVLPLFDASQASREAGFQGAMDVMGQAVPQQFSTFQQGNVGAQQALLSGLPQMQNAILGLPVDMSGFQPQALSYDTSYMNQQLPTMMSGTEALQAGEEARNVETLGGITTNEELVRAAAEGRIPNISAQDQDFWSRHLANIEGVNPGQANWIRRPEQALSNIVGVPGGFNEKNERRFSNLISQYGNLLGGQNA